MIKQFQVHGHIFFCRISMYGDYNNTTEGIQSMGNKRSYLPVLLAIALTAVSYSCMSTPEVNPQSKPDSTPSQSTPAPVVDQTPTVTVPSKQDLPVIQLTISPATVTAGGSATLTWSVTNATSVTIDHGVGSVSPSGTRKVTPTTSTIYKLTASNASGASAVKTVSVIVNPTSSGTKK
jgi:peptidoglycan-associated lipoprotein